MENEKRSSFTGKIGFVLAAAGSAVGLGNIWRFPYLAAKYGGGAFLLVYAIAMLLFAFTTVLGWSQYGSKAVEYLFGEKAVKVYKVIFVLMIVSGALMTSSLAWDISDTFNGLMMLPNLIAVVLLSPLVFKITRNYIDRKIKGKDVKPIYSFDPEIQAAAEASKSEDIIE